MTQQDAESRAVDALVKLLDSDEESIVLGAARSIYIDRPHAESAVAPFNGKQVTTA